MRILGLLLLILVCSPGVASADPGPGFRQQLGVQLPMNAILRDERGRLRALSDYFQQGPVLLVFGYYHCPRLCSTVMDGVLQGVQDVDLPFNIVGIGIDPAETPADAARKQANYAALNPAAASRMHLLTGGGRVIAELADRAGFDYAYDESSGLYTHPAGFLIATPDGRISRYFQGVRFDQRDLRLALIEASNRRIGSLSERVLLFCSHYDPVRGQYNIAVMRLVRIVGALTLLALVLGAWFMRRRSGRST